MMVFFQEAWEVIKAPGGAAQIANDHRYLFWSIIASYLPLIALIQWFMRNRFALEIQPFNFVWNLSLSILSGIGALVYLIYKPSVLLTLDLPDEQNHDYIRAVMALFALSKLFEFFDTFILAARKRPLIFLHVYHHLTTAMYCWHGESIGVTFGHIFAFVNLVIHSWMYCYYALAIIIPRHPLLRAARPYITLSQIIQMFGGMWVAYAALGMPSITGQNRVNAMLGLLMYLSYAYLFILFYLENYVKGIQPMMTISVGVMHLAAVFGLKLLWEHPQRVHLAIEIVVGCTMTVMLVQHFKPTIQSIDTLPTAAKLSSIPSPKQSVNRPISEQLPHQWRRPCLIISNFWAAWAIERQQLQQLYDMIASKKESKREEDMKKSQPDHGHLVKHLMIDLAPLIEQIDKYCNDVSNNSTHDNNNNNMTTRKSPTNHSHSVLRHAVSSYQKQSRNDWILVLLAILLPTIYGKIVHQSWLLGFLIHGCLRSCIELYAIHHNMTTASYSNGKID